MAITHDSEIFIKKGYLRDDGQFIKCKCGINVEKDSWEKHRKRCNA